MIMTKKTNALCPAIREMLCEHSSFHFSGSMPCTGRLVCHMCGIDKDQLEENRLRNYALAYLTLLEKNPNLAARFYVRYEGIILAARKRFLNFRHEVADMSRREFHRYQVESAAILRNKRRG